MSDDNALRVMATEDRQNRVFDPLRVAFMVAFVTGDALVIYTTTALAQPFDIQAFGIGMGSLIGVTGAGLWASSNQKEPAK